MKILAIDQSYTSSGIIVFMDDEMIHAERFPTSKHDNIFKRAASVADRVERVAKEYEIDAIAMEGLAFGMRGSATRDLAGLQFVIAVHMQERHGYEVIIIAPLTVKKFATGSGKAKKEKMLECVPQNIKDYFGEKLGVKKTTGLLDMVDAYWIGKTAVSIRKNK